MSEVQVCGFCGKTRQTSPGRWGLFCDKWLCWRCYNKGAHQSRATKGREMIKIELGKEYTTRHGREVEVYAVNVGASGKRVFGAVMTDDCWLQCEWEMDGSRYAKEANELDLIEKSQTVTVDIWLNVYPDDIDLNGMFYQKGTADTHANSDRIACINFKRTVTYGEGLDND